MTEVLKKNKEFGTPSEQRTEVLIAVELTPQTALKIRQMAQEGVFSMSTGNIELHFKDGNLLKIVTHKTTYTQASDVVKESVV